MTATPAGGRDRARPPAEPTHPAAWWSGETPFTDGLGMYDVPDRPGPDAYDGRGW